MLTQLNEREKYRLLDAYGQGYWSGLDADIYIGNVHMADVSQWNWVTNETVRPYYGYADYTPAKLSHGARIIQGEMSLNLQNFGFMPKLLDLMEKRDLSLSSDQQSLDKTRVNYTNNHGENPIVTLSTNQLPKIDVMTSAKTAKEFVRAFKNSQVPSGSIGNSTTLSASIPNNRGIFEVSASKKFDVTLVFGGHLRESLVLNYDHLSDGHELAASQHQKGSLYAATGLRFIDVSFMNSATSVNDDGRPILQTYQWIAKDIQIVQANEFSQTNHLKGI